jgi:hypothetical protein
LHDVRDGIARRSEKAAMDMIFLNTQFDDFPMLSFADRFKDPAKFAFDLVLPKNLASVLWRPDEMIFEIVKTVR